VDDNAHASLTEREGERTTDAVARAGNDGCSTS
jgi:hypothetical protein